MAQGEGGAGWSRVVLGFGKEVLDSYAGGPKVPFKPGMAWGVEGAKQASPNHEAGDWNAELARAAINGEAEAFERAKAVVMEAYFPREIPVDGQASRLIGLWSWETLACDAHTHQHLTGVTLARVAAWVSKDPELLRLSGELLKANARLLGSVADPETGRVWSCATRAHPPDVPAFFVGTAWLAELRDKLDLPEFTEPTRAARNWHDPMHSCIRGLRLLRQDGDDLAGAPKVEPGPVWLKYKVQVWRGQGRHLAVMARPPRGIKGKISEICDWVEVPWGQKGTIRQVAKKVRKGFGWSKEVPESLPGAFLIEHPAVRVQK